MSSARGDETHFDEMLRKIKNRPKIAALLFFGAGVIALGQFTGAVDSLLSFSGKHFTQTTPDDEQPMSLPNEQISKQEAEVLSQSVSQLPAADPLPLPPGVDQAMPGMRLSEARLFVPGGELGRGYYSVALEEEDLFSLVTYHFYGSGLDPVIDLVTLRLRDSQSRRQFFVILRSKLITFPQRVSTASGRVVWPDVNGFEISLDDSALFITQNTKRPS